MWCQLRDTGQYGVREEKAVVLIEGLARKTLYATFRPRMHQLTMQYSFYGILG